MKSWFPVHISTHKQHLNYQLLKQKIKLNTKSAQFHLGPSLTHWNAVKDSLLCSHCLFLQHWLRIPEEKSILMNLITKSHLFVLRQKVSLMCLQPFERRIKSSEKLTPSIIQNMITKSHLFVFSAVYAYNFSSKNQIQEWLLVLTLLIPSALVENPGGKINSNESDHKKSPFRFASKSFVDVSSTIWTQNQI